MAGDLFAIPFFASVAGGCARCGLAPPAPTSVLCHECRNDVLNGLRPPVAKPGPDAVDIEDIEEF